jgi:hypothetical protein
LRNAPGLTLWSRKPVGATQFGHPRLARDESDSMLLCDKGAPWENVFVHDTRLLSPTSTSTPQPIGSSSMNVRHGQMRLARASADRHASGADQIPLRANARKMSAVEGTIAGLHGQINAYEEAAGRLSTPDRMRVSTARRTAANSSTSCAELCGGSVSNAGRRLGPDNPELAKEFLTLLADAAGRCAHAHEAVRFPGTGRLRNCRRHLNTKIYAGAPFIIATTPIETDWGENQRWVEEFMASYDYRADDGAQPTDATCPCSAANPPADSTPDFYRICNLRRRSKLPQYPLQGEAEYQPGGRAMR